MCRRWPTLKWPPVSVRAFNGELHRGVAGMAGEIGHTVIDGNQPFAGVASPDALKQVGRNSLIAAVRETGSTAETLEEVILRARQAIAENRLGGCGQVLRMRLRI